MNEPEASVFEAALVGNGGLMSAINYWEVLVRARKAAGENGRDVAEALMAELGVKVATITDQDARYAAGVFDRFGRGSPAGLNLGDCFAYALAQREGEGLLFKGDDFPKTDIKSALA